MSPSKPQKPPDERIFVQQGRRHFRRAYSSTEFRIGSVILLGLAFVLAWIVWKGAHPDPELFSTGVEHLADAPAKQIDEIERAAPRSQGAVTAAPAATPSETAAAPAPAAPSAPRGALPAGLAAPGWTEGPVSQFDETNLYVKIDGREDYYKSFGFKRLVFVSLSRNENPEITVDIEMYDLGESPNALGAYAGERSAEAVPAVGSSGMSHFDRNAFYITRGRFYIRAIGSEESPAVRAELEQLKRVFEAGLPGEPLPWAYALFVGGLGFDPGKVSYTPENAFSFEFADSVYSALLKDESEMFVVKASSGAAAGAKAKEFNDGFREYGSAAEGGSAFWSRDRYIGTVAGATSHGVWLIGVRGAPDVPAAERELNRLENAVKALSGG